MYAKIFASLYQGTLRGNSDAILVFTNLLAHCDQHGYVDKHPLAIAQECGISEERVEGALQFLESPDKRSRSPAEEGRRLVRADEHRDWGWLVVNYLKYRDIRREEDRRQQNRDAQARKRKRASAHVSNRKQTSAMSAQVEADVEVEANTEAEREDSPPPASQVDPQGGAAKPRRKNGQARQLSADRQVRQAGRLPDDWQPDQACRDYAADRGLDPDSTAEAFKDWWTAENGPRATKRDWNAAFRTWCRRDTGKDGTLGKSATRAFPASRGNGAFYEQLARIASRSENGAGDRDGRPVREDAPRLIPDTPRDEPRRR